MFKNFLVLILKGIKHRPMRSWLTVLGIMIGIMLVVVILSLGDGVRAAVRKTLQMFGSDLIVIFPGKETNPFAGLLGGQKFKEDDLMELADINGVRLVVPMEVATLNVEYRGEKKAVMVHASSWKGTRVIYEESQGVKLERGRWPMGEQASEIILGYRTASTLFKSPINLEDEMTIKAKRMKVAGVVSEIGNQVDDNVIYVSLDVFRQLTGSRGGAGSAFVKPEAGADVNLVARQIKHRLSQQETVREFSVLTSEKADRLVGNVLVVVELVLIVIALISLLVGAVGVMNTMYTSVMERTKQVGIMKAIGASNDAIMTLFLIESGVIGLVGGILGAVLGIFMAYIIGLAGASFGIRGLFSFASLDYFGVLAVLMFTFAVGVISGVLPARQAARMEPAEALRYE